MAEDEVKMLEKALQNQQITVQRLQEELDEERKAAASGAEEALSMIFRLQEEKSTHKLESLQYQRMVEEKLRLNEEAMAMMRKIIFLKDTEIEALRYQFEVYKNKLMSLCVEGGHFPWFNEYIFGKGEHQYLGRRNISLPSIRFEELFLEGDDLKQGSVGSVYDDFEKKLTKTCKERKFENLFRSKSSIREISSESDGYKSDLYGSEGDFSPLRSNCGEISFLTPQKKLPRRTSSVVLLQNLCKETESISNPQDIFEIPESLKSTQKSHLDFGNYEEREVKSTIESSLEHVKVSMGCVENEMRMMRESDSVAWKKQLGLLTEIRDKINALESHIQQRDGQMEEETSNQQRKAMASCMPQLGPPSTSQTDDMLMSYYIEVFIL